MIGDKNEETTRKGIGSKFYAVISLSFVIAFGVIMVNQNSKSCENRTLIIGYLIFFTHFAELILALVFSCLIKFAKAQLTAARKCLRIFVGLWVAYLFSLFIVAQVYLYDPLNDCRTGKVRNCSIII